MFTVRCLLLVVPVNNNNPMEQVNITSLGDILYNHFLTLDHEAAPGFWFI